jgi:hypothetical protein
MIGGNYNPISDERFISLYIKDIVIKSLEIPNVPNVTYEQCFLNVEIID